MDVFFVFSLLIAASLIIAAFLGHRIRNAEAFRTAVTWFITGIILYYPVSALFNMGAYLSIVARPVGFVLVMLSLRCLCIALAPTSVSTGDDEQSGAA